MQRVKKGDTVEVLGGDDRGRRGEVNSVFPKRGRVVVHGINLVKKHQRRAAGVTTQSGIIEFEAPIDLSNVAPVCSHCDKWTRVGYSDAGERKTRVCRRCGNPLD